MPHTIRRLLLPFIVLFAGCENQQYGTFTRDVDIAGGETLKVAFEYGAPIPAENDDLKVIFASLKPLGPDLFQLFSLQVKNGRLPQSVTVEDVAGDAPELFVEDRHPQFFVDKAKPNAKTNLWTWISPSLVKQGWRPAWLNEPDDSFRVYRFTVVTGDGRTLVLYQTTRYPFFIKQLIIKTLGADQPKKDESVEEIHL
jgi:hypothetical protein